MSDPDSIPRLSYLIFIILVYLASYFAVTETAIASVSKNRIKNLAEHGDPRSIKALYALDNFDRAITTILICTNIIHISAATIVTVLVTRQFGISWVTLSTIITTIIVFFFGEMLPKSIAKKYPEKYTLSHASVLCICMKVFYPFATLLAKIGDLAAKLTKSEPEVSITEDELHDLIDDMEEEGTLDEDESDLIQSAIEFGDTKVSNIFTPRNKIVAVNVHSKPSDIIELIKSQPHSRLPVYDGGIDNIIGILQIRDYIKAYLINRENVDILPLISKVFVIRKNYNIDDILESMSDHKYTLAVVKDRNNKTMGIVSIEDILEELVGEIWDEDEAIQGGAL